MANTDTQIYIHIVFVVDRPANLIPLKHNAELHKDHRNCFCEKTQIDCHQQYAGSREDAALTELWKMAFPIKLETIIITKWYSAKANQQWYKR